MCISQKAGYALLKLWSKTRVMEMAQRVQYEAGKSNCSLGER